MNGDIPMEVNNDHLNKKYFNGDEECYICKGIMYLSKEMVEKGQAAICYGFKSKLENLDKQKTLLLDTKCQSPNEVMLTYLGVGFCFYTKRIERLGMSPLLMRGFERSQVVVDTKPEVNRNAEIQRQFERHSRITREVFPKSAQDASPLALSKIMKQMDIQLVSLKSSLSSFALPGSIRSTQKLRFLCHALSKRLMNAVSQWFGNKNTPGVN